MAQIQRQIIKPKHFNSKRRCYTTIISVEIIFHLIIRLFFSVQTFHAHSTYAYCFVKKVVVKVSMSTRKVKNNTGFVGGLYFLREVFLQILIMDILKDTFKELGTARGRANKGTKYTKVQNMRC